MTFLNGSTYPLSVLPVGTYDSNSNSFSVSTTGTATMNYYLGIQSPVGSWVLSSSGSLYSTSSGTALIGQYHTTYVQQVAAGVPALTCNPSATVATAPTVQFSYCLVTAAAQNPTLTGSVIYSNASGTLNAIALGGGSYLMTTLTGSLTYSNGSTFRGLSALPTNTYDGNSNTFTTSTTTPATLTSKLIPNCR